MKRRAFVGMSLVAAAGGSAGLARAQTGDYPSRPIRVIIPSTPGGGTDFVGRLLCTRLAELNGWNMVPENHPGANLTIGLGEAVRSAPAGYDLVVGQTDNVSLAPLLMKLPFDPQKDLAPVALVATTPVLLVVPESAPYRSLEDFIKAAKAAPGTLSYGTSGLGSATHISVELLQGEAGIKLQHVPYKGTAPAMADLIGGHLAMAGGSISSATALLKAGKVRGLSVSSPKRSPGLPDVPSVTEFGYKDQTIYYGVFAPAAIPKPIAARLNADINKILQTPEAKAALLGQGLDPSPMSIADFGALVKADAARAKDVVTKANIRLE